MSADRIGNYEIVRMLARGGMAVVYLVRQPALDRDANSACASGPKEIARWSEPSGAIVWIRPSPPSRKLVNAIRPFVAAPAGAAHARAQPAAAIVVLRHIAAQGSS